MGLTSLFAPKEGSLSASRLDPSILIDRYHRARFFVLSVLFGQFFTLGIIRPELPQLLISVFSGNVSYVSIYQGITEGVGAIVAFIALPIIGVYSDHHGRKPALFITAIFATFAPLTLCFYPTILSAEVVLVIFLLGSSVFKLNSFSVVLSYVADCQNIVHWAKEQQEQQNASVDDIESGNHASSLTPASPLIQIGSPSTGSSKFSVVASPTVGQTFKQKESSGPPSMSHAFGAASATCFFAQTLGPFLVQYLTRTESLMLATFLSVLSIVFSFLLPETVGVVPHDNGPASIPTRGTANEKTALLSAPSSGHAGTVTDKPAKDSSSKTSVLKRMTLTFEFMKEDRLYFLILLLTMISQLAVFGVGQVYYLFLIGGLHFSRVDTLTAAIIGGIETILILLVVLPLVNKRVGDNALLLVAFASYVIYCLLVSAAQTKEDAFVVIIFWAISEMVRPIFSSLLAVYASANKQGLAQGALTSMRGLASGIGPFLFAIIFSFAAKSVPVPHEGAAVAPASSEHPSPSSGRFTFGYWSFSSMAVTFFIAALLSYISFILALYLPLPSSSSDKTEIQFKRARPTRSFANRFALGTFGTVIILATFASVEWAEQKYLDPAPTLPAAPSVVADFSSTYAKSLCASSHCDLNLFERYSKKHHSSAALKQDALVSESTESSYSLSADQIQELKKLSPLHLAFLGAPGVGKTSFADTIAPLLGLCHVATGVLIRAEIASGSDLGASIADIVHSGGLVNDTVVTQLLMNRLKEKDCEGGFILDGFPRRTSQAEILSRTPSLRLHAVLDLEMDRELVLSRVSGRRVCPKCGLTYNIAGIVDAKEGYNIPPRLPKDHEDLDHLKCDADGTALEKRADDQAEIARHRMEIYEKETAPLIEYYSNNNKNENILITWNIHKGVQEELPQVIELIVKQSIKSAQEWTKKHQQ